MANDLSPRAPDPPILVIEVPGIGIPGPPGPPGPAGGTANTPGIVIGLPRTPLYGDGQVGDWYINTVSGERFGPKIPYVPTPEELASTEVPHCWPRTPTDVVPEAPEDDLVYGRSNKAWVPIETGGGEPVPEDPITGLTFGGPRPPTDTDGLTGDWWIDTASGNFYGPKQEAPATIWPPVPATLPPAPRDGIQYGRMNGAWVPIITGLITSRTPVIDGQATKLYPNWHPLQVGETEGILGYTISTNGVMLKAGGKGRAEIRVKLLNSWGRSVYMGASWDNQPITQYDKVLIESNVPVQIVRTFDLDLRGGSVFHLWLCSDFEFAPFSWSEGSVFLYLHELPEQTSLRDAPEDGRGYIRKNGRWVALEDLLRE